MWDESRFMQRIIMIQQLEGKKHRRKGKSRNIQREKSRSLVV
jgi:hypothetical protein